MPRADTIHFHSHQTGVSLELPPDWRVEVERQGEAIYASANREGVPVTPKLIIKTFTVPDDPDAWQAVADQMRWGAGKQRLTSRQTKLSMVPARIDITAYDAPELGQRLFHLQTFCQIGDVVFSISGIAGWDQRYLWQPRFAAALRTVRFAGGPLPAGKIGRGFYHPLLSLSVRLPPAWTAEDVAGKPMFRLFSQPYPNYGDYRCSLSFLMTLPDELGSRPLEELAAAKRAEQERHHPQFTLISQEAFTLSCGAEVSCCQFTWYHRPTEMDIYQLSALMLTGEGVLYTISGAALRPLDSSCRRKFISAVKSARVLARQP